jgi:hypothetical protein
VRRERTSVKCSGVAKRRTQRDVIRELYAKHGNDVDRILKGVEKAVKRGEFRRERNKAEQRLHKYVLFLLEEGLSQRKTSNTGWLLTK